MVFEDTYQSTNKGINKPVDFDQFGWLGHHGPEGNRHFFEQALWPRLQKFNAEE